MLSHSVEIDRLIGSAEFARMLESIPREQIPRLAAAILGISLDDVRQACEAFGFAERRYMSPTMMRNAVGRAGGRIAKTHEIDRTKIAFDVLELPRHGLARIQFEGPWTKPGANPKWAYCHTHWIAVWMQRGETGMDQIAALLNPVIFDVNSGLLSFETWEDVVVPDIVKSIPRADGDWHMTHSWEVEASEQ